MGLVALHGTLFTFLTDDPNLGEQYFKDYALVFAVILLLVVILNIVFLALDTYYPLLKLAVVLNILDESVLDPNRDRIVDDFSNSSDSLTEKDMTIGSKEMGKYHADYEDDKIEYNDPKEKVKRLEVTKKKPKTPPKTQEPLMSSYGPKVIPLSNVKELDGGSEKSLGDAGIKTLPQMSIGDFLSQEIKGSMTPQPKVEDKSKTPSSPKSDKEEEKNLDKSNSDDGKSTPKEGNIITPAMSKTGGFKTAEFDLALKEANETKDYNFLPYKK
jgi:hypothetical protein